MSTLLFTAQLVESPEGGVSRVIDRRIALSQEAAKKTIKLASDGATAVGLDGITPHFVQIETDRKVVVRFTSADGTQQSIPVDDFLCILSRSVPFTAIDLARVAGQDATVVLTLGQKTT